MTFVVSPDCGIVLKAGNRHLPPLKRGGVDNASNVQWQTIEAAKIKILHGFCPCQCCKSKALPPQWVWGLDRRLVASMA